MPIPTKNYSFRTCSKATALLLLAGVSTPALAGNNGVNFNLTLGGASGGMGGVGYVRPLDAFSSVFGNPATMGQFEGNTSFTFGASYIRVEPTNTHDGSVVPAFTDTTDFANFLVPTVAVRQRLTDKLTFGTGITVRSGLASDFREAPLSPIVSYIHFGAPMVLSYQVTDNLSIGGGAELTFGLLEFGLTSNTSLEQDPGLRFNVGFTYDLGPIMVGATYYTKAKQTFRNVTQTDVSPAGPVFSDIGLDQPWEINGGFATTDQFSENLLVEVNFLYQAYGQSFGFRDLWVDQAILGGGVQYKIGKISLRGGYNYHFNLRREDVSQTTSVAGLTQVVAPVGPGGAPAPVPIFPGFVQLVQATLAQPYWNHQASAGFGYDFNDNIRFDFSATLAFGDEPDFGGNTLSDLWEAHAQFGIQWRF